MDSQMPLAMLNINKILHKQTVKSRSRLHIDFKIFSMTDF